MPIKLLSSRLARISKQLAHLIIVFFEPTYSQFTAADGPPFFDQATFD